MFLYSDGIVFILRRNIDRSILLRICKDNFSDTVLVNAFVKSIIIIAICYIQNHHYVEIIQYFASGVKLI